MEPIERAVQNITKFQKTETVVSEELAEMAINSEDSKLFEHLGTIKRTFEKLGIKCSGNSVQYFVMFAKRFETLRAVNGALQTKVNELDKKSLNIFSAMESNGITADFLAKELAGLLEDDNDPRFKLQVLKTVIPLQVEKDRHERFLGKKRETKKADVIEIKSDKGILKNALSKIINPKIADLGLK